MKKKMKIRRKSHFYPTALSHSECDAFDCGCDGCDALCLLLFPVRIFIFISSVLGALDQFTLCECQYGVIIVPSWIDDVA